jgi:hypothetical protein
MVFCRHCGVPLSDRPDFPADLVSLAPPQIVEDTIVFPVTQLR